MNVDLQTHPLRINHLVPADAPALLAYRSDPAVACFQSWVPATLRDVEDFLARNAATEFGAPETWNQLAIRLDSTGELVGDLGVHFVGSDGHQVEIGFTIAPRFQRRGFGSLAVTALLGHLFTVQGKHRVFASVDPRNEASMRLLRGLGLRQEAHFRESLFWKGEWVDDVVFAMLRSEWQERPALRHR